jgi:hypothetical protein
MVKNMNEEPSQKKIKVYKIHESKICKETDLKATEMRLKEYGAELHLSKAILDFDDALCALILKHLKKVPRKEIERVYGAESDLGETNLAELIQLILDTEKKWPMIFRAARLPYIC